MRVNHIKYLLVILHFDHDFTLNIIAILKLAKLRIEKKKKNIVYVYFITNFITLKEISKEV